jgi:hypothetical protein
VLKDPKSDGSTLDDLIDELARVLHEPESARLIVLRSGFPPGDVPNFDVPRVFWSRVIRAAAAGKSVGGVQSIVEAASAQLPGNSFLANFRTDVAPRIAGWFRGSRRLKYSACITAILAVPLAVAIVALLPTTQRGFPGDYDWFYSGNASTTRGSKENDPWNTLPIYLESSTLQIEFRPKEPTYDPIDIVAFANDWHGNRIRLNITPRFSPSGDIAIRNYVRDTGLFPGEWEMVFAIGRKATLPLTFDDLSDEGSQDYQVFRGALIVKSVKEWPTRARVSDALVEG